MLLEFHGKNPALIKTLFRENGGTVHLAVRGKSPGAQRDAGTFQWSSAVRALSTILTKAVLVSRYRKEAPPPALKGFAGSLASSLDYAISKEPEWTIDMFGVDVSGRSNLRRIIARTNADRKLPGPVILGLKSEILPPQTITIWWNRARVVEPWMLNSLIDLLELQSGSRSVVESPEEFVVKRPKAA